MSHTHLSFNRGGGSSGLKGYLRWRAAVYVVLLRGGFEGDVEAGTGGEGDEYFEAELFPFASDQVGDASFVVAS